MTDLAPITRYTCPLAGCGWTCDPRPFDGPAVIKVTIRLHADSHSSLEYVQALLAAQSTAAQARADTLREAARSIRGRDVDYLGMYGAGWLGAAEYLEELAAEL